MACTPFFLEKECAAERLVQEILARVNWHCSQNRIMQSQYITLNPLLMSGTPCFAGTRVPVKSLFDYLEAGDSLDEFLDQFPTVTRDAAVHVLEESRLALMAA
jgi:uncharacterized protein (DUF433 family)